VGAVTLAADEPKLIERGQALARQEHIYLEMGVGVFQPPALYHDEAILIDPQGQVVWIYQKAHPVPGLDNFAPGNGIVPVASTPYGRLANVICFDADFPDLMRQGGSAGVDIMLVPGNDWQGIDPWHTHDATFRAIENGYSLVRQASNGLAMTVDYEGHVLGATDYFTVDQQTMVASVPMKGVWTIYAYVGDLFAWLCIAGLIFMGGFVVFTSSRKRTRTPEALSEQSSLNSESELKTESGA
jgi:apolipoprotein N-acyltransferase